MFEVRSVAASGDRAGHYGPAIDPVHTVKPGLATSIRIVRVITVVYYPVLPRIVSYYFAAMTGTAHIIIS